jgi:hypothetical protein
VIGEGIPHRLNNTIILGDFRQRLLCGSLLFGMAEEGVDAAKTHSRLIIDGKR